MNLPEVIGIPTESWVPRLHAGNFIWLCKEMEYARVNHPYIDSGYICGRLYINRMREEHDGLHFVGLQAWYVNKWGRGLDGSQLFAPCEGHLPDVGPEVPELQKLIVEVNQLQNRVRSLEDFIGDKMELVAVDLLTSKYTGAHMPDIQQLTKGLFKLREQLLQLANFIGIDMADPLAVMAEVGFVETWKVDLCPKPPNENPIGGEIPLYGPSASAPTPSRPVKLPGRRFSPWLRETGG